MSSILRTSVDVQHWAEMTVLGNKEPGSVWDLGRYLWSPKANKGGSEYRIMTEPQRGDLVLHLVAGVERSISQSLDLCKFVSCDWDNLRCRRRIDHVRGA